MLLKRIEVTVAVQQLQPSMMQRVGHEFVVNHNVGSRVCSFLKIVHTLWPSKYTL